MLLNQNYKTYFCSLLYDIIMYVHYRLLSLRIAIMLEWSAIVFYKKETCTCMRMCNIVNIVITLISILGKMIMLKKLGFVQNYFFVKSRKRRC